MAIFSSWQDDDRAGSVRGQAGLERARDPLARRPTVSVQAHLDRAREMGPPGHEDPAEHLPGRRHLRASAAKIR